LPCRVDSRSAPSANARQSLAFALDCGHLRPHRGQLHRLATRRGAKIEHGPSAHVAAAASA